MGYYSDFDGEFKPTVKLTDEQHSSIVDWFVKRFGNYEVKGDGEVDFHPDKDGGYYTGDIYFDPDEEVVRPVCGNMKGYDFNEQLYEFVEFAKTIGVNFEGGVERIGEEFGDMEKIEILKGNVLSYQGRIDYGSPVRIAETEAAKRARFERMFKSNQTKGE